MATDMENPSDRLILLYFDSMLMPGGTHLKPFALFLAFVYLLQLSLLANASTDSQDLGKNVLMNMGGNTSNDVRGFAVSDDAYNAAENQSFSIAIPARNLSGRSAWDILMLKLMSNSTDGTIASEISALKGSDGSLLWQKRYQDAVAYAFSVDDLNGDGSSDVVVDVALAGMSFIPYSELLVLDGCNGSKIWRNPTILAATIAYPLNRTELLVHSFSIDPMNKSAVTKISSILQADGKEIDSKIFQGAIAVEYPAENITGNAAPNSILAVYNIDEKNSSVSTDISALSGLDHSKQWNKTYSNIAIAIPNEDVTGDGIADIVVYELSPEENDTYTSIILLRGVDGKALWKRAYSDSMAVASTVHDLTGDGINDFIIYKFGGSGTKATGIEAVKGDEGLLLWSRSSTILMLR